MSVAKTSTIFVLTDTRKAYGEMLNKDGEIPFFVNSIEALISELREVSIAGLVLEVDKVMKSSRRDRDRLFKYADNFPVMRTRVDSRHGQVTYLDPRDSFFKNLTEAMGKRQRNFDRIKLSIDCTFSREEDPSMVETHSGTILDISPGGCFINTTTPIEDEQFINVRIPQLKNSRPIYSSIRWTRPECESATKCGMGIMFIDLTEGQAEDIIGLGPTSAQLQEK